MSIQVAGRRLGMDATLAGGYSVRKFAGDMVGRLRVDRQWLFGANTRELVQGCAITTEAWSTIDNAHNPLRAALRTLQHGEGSRALAMQVLAKNGLTLSELHTPDSTVPLIASQRDSITPTPAFRINIKVDLWEEGVEEQGEVYEF